MQADFQAEQLSPENKQKERTIEELTREIIETKEKVQESYYLKLIEGNEDMKRAAAAGDRAAEEAAKEKVDAAWEENQALI